MEDKYFWIKSVDISFESLLEPVDALFLGDLLVGSYIQIKELEQSILNVTKGIEMDSQCNNSAIITHSLSNQFVLSF